MLVTSCKMLHRAPTSQCAFRRVLGRRMYSQSSHAPTCTVAVLFQDIDPPVINGVRKPHKPGGKCDYLTS